MSHLRNNTIRDRRGRNVDNNAFYQYYTHPPPFCQDNNNHYFHPQQQGPQQQCYPYLHHPHHPSPFTSCDFVHSPGLKEVVTSFFPPSTTSQGINMEQRKSRYPNQYWILLGVLFLIIILLGICLIWIGHQGANSSSRDCHDEVAEKVIIINNNHKADYTIHHGEEGSSDNVNLEIPEEPVLTGKAVTFSLNDEEETTVETVEM